MLCLLHGPDSWRSRAFVRQLQNRFIQEADPTGMNSVTLDGEQLAATDLATAVRSGGFFSTKRLVVVQQLLRRGKKDVQQAAIELITHGIPDDVSLLFWEADSVDKRGSLAKRLLAEKYSQEFTLLDDTALLRMLRDEIKQRSLRITDAAIHELIRRTGNDLWQLHNELDKLSATAPEHEITPATISEMVAGRFDDNIFRFVDAIADCQLAAATRLLQEQRTNGAEELYILAMLIRQFRLLLQVADLPTGIPPATVARMLKIHPFVAKKISQQAHRFTVPQLQAIYHQLVAADSALKLNTPEPIVLDRLLVGIQTSVNTKG